MEEKIKEVTTKLLSMVGINVEKIEINHEDHNIIRVNIISDDNAGILIGRHGETLNALQHILKSLLWKDNPENIFFLIVDADHYKKRQQENIVIMAEKKANMVKESGNTQILPPMAPYFRKLIHLHFKDNNNYSDIKTESIGEGDRRQIKIVSA